MSAAEYNSHVLSKKSKERGHNLFIWSIDKCHLEGGFRLDSRNQLTISTLYQWIEILLSASTTPRTDQTQWDSELYRVNIKPFPAEVFKYKPAVIGNVLSPTSGDLLQPGDLGMNSLYIRFWEPPTLVALEDGRKQQGEDTVYNLSDHGFIEGVLKRDNNRCCFTGATERLTVIWAFPPWLADYAWDPHAKPRVENRKDQFTAQNALTLREDIAALFKRQQIAVDVEDNYRIVFFGPCNVTPPVQFRSRLDLSSVDESVRPCDDFLRKHFRHTLRVHMIGGDRAHELWNEGFEFDEYLADLGIDVDNVDIADPDLQDEIGQEIVRVLIGERLQRYSDSYSDTEESE